MPHPAPTKQPMKKKPNSQIDRFRETARQLECDEDQERFEKKLGKIAKAKPSLAKKVDDDAS